MHQQNMNGFSIMEKSTARVVELLRRNHSMAREVAVQNALFDDADVSTKRAEIVIPPVRVSDQSEELNVRELQMVISG
jgi:hypothetical protein